MTAGIRNFYHGKTVFITGASGFMGKVLLEKLLYSCSELKEIFILMRPKRGKSGAERVQDFKTIPVSFLLLILKNYHRHNKHFLQPFKVFKRICDEKPEMFEKIIPVFGDITSKGLGLSEDQYQQVVKSTNVVFHMAASLKLEATLKPNVEMNLLGTKQVIDVCKNMPKLLALVHLSTAFCNSDQDVLKEEVYEWSQKPMDLIRCAEWMTEDAMDAMGRKLIAPHPNTYTYTKRLAELLVRDEHPRMPVCIVRPSIG